MSNTEYRIVIKFFTQKGFSVTEITKELTDVYGDSASSHRTVVKWVTKFNDPPRVFEDAPRSGRSTTPVTDQSIQAVEEVVIRVIDKFLFEDVADELSISKTLLYEIIIDYLRMTTVCMRWVPKLFTPLQHAN